MNTNLFDLLAQSARSGTHRVDGVVIGIVTNNHDPDAMARVRVKFPWLSGTDESWWARIAVPMAGDNRGTYFLPEVDDEVLVTFEHGDIRFPFIIGAMWNGKQPPPTKNDNGKNDIRLIRSRCGHEIRLDDGDGKEKIEIKDKDGNNTIVIESAGDKITIKSKGTVQIESQDKVIIEGTTIDIKATGPLKIKGATVDIN
jgi:uncharacterized protein involved in type VI secretion and phage assembly